jgi:hypothetical protein
MLNCGGMTCKGWKAGLLSSHYLSPALDGREKFRPAFVINFDCLKCFRQQNLSSGDPKAGPA